MKSSAIYPLFFLLFFIAQYAVLKNTLTDPDTGWHIVAGDYIIENGIPTTNPFSFTSKDYEWQNISWLWDVAFAQFHSLGGLYLIALITILASSLTAVLILRESILRTNLVCGTIATTIAIFALIPAILVRPYLAGIILFFIFYKIIPSNKRLYLLPLLMILWVNIHGSFLAAITIFGAVGFEYLLKRDFKNLIKLVMVFGFTALATLINPLGIKVYDAVSRTIDGNLQNYITEWQPISEISMMIYPIIFLGLLATTIKHHKISDILLTLFWLVQSFLSARYLPIFMIISAPVAAKAIYSLKNFESKNQEYEQDLSNNKAIKISYFLCLGAIIYSAAFPQKIKLQNDIAEEIKYLKKNHSDSRILNFYDYGGAMIFSSSGKLQTFIDGRAETAFPPEVADDYIKFSNQQKGWGKIPAKYDIEVIFIPKDSPQIQTLQDWKTEFTGSKAVILIKK